MIRLEVSFTAPAISTNPSWSYIYAAAVLQAPFPLGEAAIATSAGMACNYALDALHGPFPLGEPAIAKSARLAAAYYSAFYSRQFSSTVEWRRSVLGDQD